MGKFLRHDPCSNCDSSDGVAVYDDDAPNKCMVCDHLHKIGGLDVEKVMDETEGFDTVETQDAIMDYPIGTQQHRRVTIGIAEMYGVRHSVNPDGTRGDIFYPYMGANSDRVSYKVRKQPKDFRVLGGLNKVQLFGQHLFPEGGKQVVVTEGEEDALAVAQAMKSHYGKVFPVVSIPSSSNLKPVSENMKWLQSFKHVILWMDNDEAGEKAKKAIAKIIGYEKCKIASSSANDASELLQEDKYKQVMEGVWNATMYNPQGILGKAELWQQVVDYSKIESVPYPECFAGLNEKTKGMRFGEISLFTSGTGAGKSTMLREVADHLLKETEDRIGIISLEESPAETAKKMASLRLNKNPSATEIPLEELHGAFEEVFGDDRVLVLDHQGAITESITAQLQYMAAVGCKYLFIDHITILVSEGAEGLTGNEAVDKVMNELLKIAKTHNVWIGLISHLRKSDKVGKSFEQGNLPSLDDIRGSGSIKQISNDVIAFARNSEEGCNEIEMRVLKCRHTGLTGNAGSVAYDNNTGRLSFTGVTEVAGF